MTTHVHIEGAPEEIARLAIRDDSGMKIIDALTPQQARAWFDIAVQTAEGRIKILKYMFCKLHDKI